MAKVRELCGLIHSKYDSEADFARALGWPRQKLNRITTGAKEPDLQEVSAMATELGYGLDEIASIFLQDKSPNEQQTVTTE